MKYVFYMLRFSSASRRLNVFDFFVLLSYFATFKGSKADRMLNHSLIERRIHQQGRVVKRGKWGRPAKLANLHINTVMLLKEERRKVRPKRGRNMKYQN